MIKNILNKIYIIFFSKKIQYIVSIEYYKDIMFFDQIFIIKASKYTNIYNILNIISYCLLS